MSIVRIAAGALLLWSLVGCEVTFAPSFDPRGEIVLNEGEGGRAQSNDGGGRACPGPVRSGITECFPGECGPGQFCDERSGGSGECRPGCTSDQGCGPNDVCVRAPGSAIGRCEPCRDRPKRAIEGCGAPDRSGMTPCFPGQCGPGQYCVDRGMPHCEPGCTSDENCGPTERCEREDGSALGVCRSCDFE